MAYEWTKAEKEAMKPGTALVRASLGHYTGESLVLFTGPDLSKETHATVAEWHDGMEESSACQWRLLRPWSGPIAPPLSTQERELFAKRCGELGKAQAKLDAAIIKHTDLTKALSAVLHDSVAREDREALTLALFAEMVELAGKRRHSVLAALIARYPDLFDGVPRPTESEADLAADLPVPSDGIPSDF
jgi:hypothetical protein